MKNRRTKIVCTIGPASSSAETLKALIQAGMDIARLNFSHGSHKDHAAIIANLKTLSRELRIRVPILQDLSGPKMRIGKLSQDRIELVSHSTFVLTTRDVIGDETSVSVNTPELIEALKPDDRILLADGELEFKVISKTDFDAECEVVVGGELTSNQGINAPGITLKKSVPTEKDINDLTFGIKQGVNWVAQSFIRSAGEIKTLRSIIKKNNADIPIIAKLEKREALDDLDRIIQEADGVMIARGDLGLEIPIQEVPLVQKEIIKRANDLGKPEITATQMLESMMTNPRPTRAEVADIANAVFDGTDALMLSGETAAGRYPVAAVRTMADVALATEERVDYIQQFRNRPIKLGDDVHQAMSHAACQTALEIGAKVIICCTRSGQTARLVSKYRPHARIAVASPYEEVLMQTLLFWGTYPIKIKYAENTDDMIEEAKKATLETGLAKSGDRVVIVAGIPFDIPGITNIIKADVL
jgi:pyruvate kinase